MVITYGDLAMVRQKSVGKIVYARGAFDVLHGGHADFIKFAQTHGDLLVLGVISDGVIRKNKGSDRPVRTEEDRAYLLEMMKGVDCSFVVPPPDGIKSSTELVLESLRPDVFVLFDEEQTYTQHFEDLVKRYGVQLVLDGSSKRSSSTELIGKMRNPRSSAGH